MAPSEEFTGSAARSILRAPVRIGVVAAAITLCLACGLIARLLLSRPPRSAPNLMCVTTGCGYQANRPLRIGEILPLACPECGRRSVYGTHVCRQCGTAVVLNRQRGIDAPTDCPRCGREVSRGQ
jgi:DNA-directed RNA polymerase subunit RPC12/RpoP